MVSSTCARISRPVTVSVSSRIRSASVDLPWSMCAMIEKLRMRLCSIGLWRVAAVEPHQAVRQAVLLDVADVPEAGLLEGAPRTAVRLVDRGDACVRLRAREDDLLRELGQHARAEPGANQVGLADQQVDTCDALTDPNDRLPLRMLLDEV